MANAKYKKFMAKLVAGVSGIGFIALLFYLQALGYLVITGYSGDQNCAGTASDSCFAYINFSAKRSFNVPSGNWLITDQPIKNVTMQIMKDGKWENYDFSKTGKFISGKDYQIRFIALKNHPLDVIKWGFENVDPVWGAGEAKKKCDYDSVSMPQWRIETVWNEANSSFIPVSVEYQAIINLSKCKEKITFADDELIVGNKGCTIDKKAIVCDAGLGADGNGDGICQSGETCTYYKLDKKIELEKIENGGKKIENRNFARFADIAR